MHQIRSSSICTYIQFSNLNAAICTYLVGSKTLPLTTIQQSFTKQRSRVSIECANRDTHNDDPKSNRICENKQGEA